MKLSEKALGIKPSSTLSITEKAGILRSEGKNVISFSIGEPDLTHRSILRKPQLTQLMPALQDIQLRQVLLN